MNICFFMALGLFFRQMKNTFAPQSKKMNTQLHHHHHFLMSTKGKW
jgi:hypothetical protein